MLSGKSEVLEELLVHSNEGTVSLLGSAFDSVAVSLVRLVVCGVVLALGHSFVGREWVETKNAPCKLTFRSAPYNFSRERWSDQCCCASNERRRHIDWIPFCDSDW